MKRKTFSEQLFETDKFEWSEQDLHLCVSETEKLPEPVDVARIAKELHLIRLLLEDEDLIDRPPAATIH